MDPRPRRPAPRLPGFDYTTARAYFITVCTAERARILSEVNESGVRVTALGEVVNRQLEALSRRFHASRLDPGRVVMPDHLHAIIWLSVRSRSCLGSVVGLFKAGCARECRRLGLFHNNCQTIWQRGYYDRVIRSDWELTNFRRYMEDNPRRWHEENTKRAG